MARALWWVLSIAAVVLSLWVWTSWTMFDISTGCSKSGEGDGEYDCADKVVDVVGSWPVLGFGLLMTAPPTMAALVRRRWVSWLAVLILAGISVIGLASWDGFWGALLYAIPLTTVGALAAAVDRSSGRRAPDA